MADLEHDVPITPQSVFHIASTSKQFTAASVALLALDKKLTLTDDIRTYFPELPDYGKPIRINDLLHHTSGLRDHFALMSLAGTNQTISARSSPPNCNLRPVLPYVTGAVLNACPAGFDRN